jgi:hypothetical protein
MILALIIFDRPDLTRDSLVQIQALRPDRLHVISDGPHPSRPGSAERVEQCRRLVEEFGQNGILRKHYAEQNMGCRRRVLSGLDEVFEEELEAIILEDDIRFSPGFLQFCENGLKAGSDLGDVGALSVTSFQGLRRRADTPSFRSIYFGSWGWATWRDRWQAFRTGRNEMTIFGLEHPPAWLRMNQAEWKFWRDRIGQAARGELDSWAYLWQAFCWQQSWFVLRTRANLTRNVGFRTDATHTRDRPPGVMTELESWEPQTVAELRSAPRGKGDAVLSDWIRPGSHRWGRRLARWWR